MWLLGEGGSVAEDGGASSVTPHERKYRRWLATANDGFTSAKQDLTQLVGLFVGGVLTIGLTALAVLKEAKVPSGQFTQWGAIGLAVASIAAAIRYVNIRKRSLSAAFEAAIYEHTLDAPDEPKAGVELVEEVSKRTQRSPDSVWRAVYTTMEDDRFLVRFVRRPAPNAQEPPEQRPFAEQYIPPMLLAMILMLQLFVSLRPAVLANDVWPAIPPAIATIVTILVMWFVFRVVGAVLYPELSLRPEAARRRPARPARASTREKALRKLAERVRLIRIAQDVAVTLLPIGLAFLPAGDAFVALYFLLATPLWFWAAIRTRRTLRPKIVTLLAEYLASVTPEGSPRSRRGIEEQIEDMGIAGLEQPVFVSNALRYDLQVIAFSHSFKDAGGGVAAE